MTARPPTHRVKKGHESGGPPMVTGLFRSGANRATLYACCQPFHEALRRRGTATGIRDAARTFDPAVGVESSPITHASTSAAGYVMSLLVTRLLGRPAWRRF